MIFSLCQNHETIGLGSILFLVCASMWISTVPLHIHGTTDTTSEAYNTGANQVGEMFANYNLIAAIAFFYCHYWQNIRVENCCTCMRRTWSYVHLFHKEPTVFTMEWLQWLVLESLASILSIPMPCYQVLPSNKMGYYMGFSTSLS
jgi:maltose/moltooligosaccharide transporter